MNSEFSKVDEEKWLLLDEIGKIRKEKLLNSGTYKTLLKDMAKLARVKFYKREKCKEHPSYYRVVAHLELSGELIDLFHNSNYGYRAQYYISEKNGERANKYALNILTPIILSHLEKKHKHTCPPHWVEQSLNGEFSKIWIHQGKWMLKKKISDRNLYVDRWQSQDLEKLDEKSRKRVIWATLTPDNEKVVNIMGSFINLDDAYLKENLKSLRSEHLYKLGYT